MKFTHFFQIPFTGLGLHDGFRGDKWFKNRIEVFNQFTFLSLNAQTNQGFYRWFCFRPEEKSNPNLSSIMRNSRDVYTFGGIGFWDDKYEDKVAAERLMGALEISLPVVKPLVKTDYVLVTIQPSDDMYLSDTAQRIQDKFSELLAKDLSTRKAVGYRRGYIMNYRTKEIAEYMSEPWKTDETSTYHTDTIPPFFTVLFSKEEFLNPQKHYKHLGPYKSHEWIADHLDYHELKGRGFIVGCHGENISTTYNHRYKGRILTKEETNSILSDVGALDSGIAFRASVRNRIRGIISLLPCGGFIKRVYNLLPLNLRNTIRRKI